MTKSGAKLEHVEVFQAWKKRPRSKVTVSRHISLRPSSDDHIEDIYQRYLELGDRPPVEGSRELALVGARLSRTENKVVFLPRELVGTEPSLPRGVQSSGWELPNIGLSVALRQKPELAAQALKEVVRVMETSAPEVVDALAVLEGK